MSKKKKTWPSKGGITQKDQWITGRSSARSSFGGYCDFRLLAPLGDRTGRRTNRWESTALIGGQLIRQFLRAAFQGDALITLRRHAGQLDPFAQLGIDIDGVDFAVLPVPGGPVAAALPADFSPWVKHWRALSDLVGNGGVFQGFHLACEQVSIAARDLSAIFPIDRDRPATRKEHRQG